MIITHRAIAVGLRNGVPTPVVLTSGQQSTAAPLVSDFYQIYGLNSSGQIVPVQLNSSNGLLS